MTRAEIRAMSRKALGETTTAFWTDGELNTYINIGCKDLAWRTKCLRKTGYMGSVSCDPNLVSAKSNEYVISTYFPDCHSILEVYFKQDGKRFLRLEPTLREALDHETDGWQSSVGYTFTDTTGLSAVTTYNFEAQTSIPTKYYWSREEDLLGIYPPPNDDQEGTEYIKVYYAYSHSDIAADTNSPVLPVAIHLAVVDFVVARGLEDRGWGDRANDAWTKYYQKIKDYTIEKKREREDEEIIMKGYRNV